jgi:ABC-type glycerol-3-phosphate transport system permease component
MATVIVDHVTKQYSPEVTAIDDLNLGIEDGEFLEFHLLSAAAFLLMIVPLIVFFALQRYFVQGLLAGSVKT